MAILNSFVQNEDLIKLYILQKELMQKQINSSENFSISTVIKNTDVAIPNNTNAGIAFFDFTLITSLFSSENSF